MVLARGSMDLDNVMTPLQAAANYRIAYGTRAGQKVLSLQLAPSRLARSRESSALYANAHGFSLHAGVRCAADDRQGLEQLCRYITRTAIANERVNVNRAGQVVLKPKTTWRDGTNHHVMEPMEFMQHLAALVPTANAPMQEGDCLHMPAGSTKGRMRWAQMVKRVFDIDIEHCPHCGGQLNLIAPIEEPVAIARIWGWPHGRRRVRRRCGWICIRRFDV